MIGRLRPLLLVCLWLLSLLPVAANAWNAAGHRLVARIAWDLLDPPTRTRIYDLLQAHPDIGRWQTRSGAKARDIFIDTSTWADELRGDRRFFSPGQEEPTPWIAGFPDMERHTDWHYVNRPLTPGTENTAAERGQLDAQLDELTLQLGSHRATPTERAYALVWLIHLVADAHQPLHAVIPPRSAVTDDEVLVFAPNSARKMVTLHAYWDDLPGPSRMSREALDRLAQEWRATAPVEARRLLRSLPEEWIAEDLAIARWAVDIDTQEQPTMLSEAYRQQAAQVARERITIAAYRLADLLRRQIR